MLAAYACDPLRSLGRRYAQASDPLRNEFQRDRDRIVHSTAFRRLVYKTQVFVNHEGDLFRTRLTHSLEVAQLGRSMARSLRLHEDLVEAIALAHDLGHTPFGHAGQDALNECMAAYGGFEHNLQSLRVVDALEERYPDFDGLNLCFETREGILKHCSRANAERMVSAEAGEGLPVGVVGQRFLDRTQPSLEAQLCNLADEIAYNAHDIDDGVRSGLLSLDQLQEVELFDAYRRHALSDYPQLGAASHVRRLLYEATRRMLSTQVHDVIESSQAALAEALPRSVQDVRQRPVLITFGSAMRTQSTQLKQFLLQNLYRHPQVSQTMAHAKRVVGELFACYLSDPAQMQAGHATKSRSSPDDFGSQGSAARVVADYIAGMTDRFATREHERLTGQRLFA
ncbi:deoxyguanosinetriphosphate triphosphohydrolase [Rhodoferax sp.]|uniref:deoxyguanosinetriphosphate triphosphohydrolase n=1 Tax=Rhodoferax sp. TaxID=50421 RepID=UPI0027678F26|nr:deoxyguanosinetriphosphate triphosphohydrolase [Rhodoferax sp.]